MDVRPCNTHYNSIWLGLPQGGDFDDLEVEVKQEPEKKEVKGDDDDGIDPTMKQYMAMVAQQKEREKQVSLLDHHQVFVFVQIS